MNYTIIVLGVVVIILLYILYKYFSTTSVSLSSLASLNTSPPAIPMLANSTSRNYAYGIWVSVNSWDNNNYKVIFSRPSSGTSSFKALNGDTNARNNITKCNLKLPQYLTTPQNASQISLYLDKTTPTLYCYIDQPDTSCDNKVGPIALTTNFPLQTWVYVVVSVQNQYIDLYLQGKLVKSVQLTSVPTQPGDDSNSVSLGKDAVASSNTTPWDASVAKFQYYTNSLNPQDVWSNYMAGNGQKMLGTSFSSYGVNVDLTANGVKQNSFKLL